MSSTESSQEKRTGRLPPFRDLISLGSWLIAMAVILIGIWLGPSVNGRMPDSYLNIIGALAVPWLILPSAMAIRFKETPRPGMPSVKGFPAIAGGILGILVFGGLEVFFFAQLLREWLGK